MVSGGRDYSGHIEANVHLGLATPEDAKIVMVRGDNLYQHYGCDGFDNWVSPLLGYLPEHRITTRAGLAGLKLGSGAGKAVCGLPCVGKEAASHVLKLRERVTPKKR
ncbi:hypothetical protein O3P69_014525 [Scylla paramamosain]|uniref:Uncharacterized protein n=1 Tax=Scylla paramamosain TaxID=85552 RepID=A0AAW0TCI4_SCYPA